MSIERKKSNKFRSNYRFLRAEDIEPKDDTHHGNIKLLDIEWWYFDAIFDNGYSVQIGFRIYHIKKIGIVQSRINIYKDGKPVSEKLKIDFLSNFRVDKNFPNIYLNKNKVVQFDEDAYTNKNKWKYRIELSIKDSSVDLIFTGKTFGWKVETSDTCWTVPLPKAFVEGNIVLNGEKIKVKGVGYHDHNWSYSPTTAMNNFGWFWGRISADSLTITWAKVIHNKNDSDILAVINRDEHGYYNINPNNIIISTKNYKMINKGSIPKDFNLKINDNTTNNVDINCQIDMKTLDIQYTRIFTIKYWRYHVKTNGLIAVGNLSEKIKDKIQIIEYLKFKSKELNKKLMN
jgi:predicted secreted hydrolase